MKKSITKKIVLILAAIMLVFSTVCSAAICYIFLGDYGIFNFRPHLFTREDNVTVGDQYKILATSELTEAYKNGEVADLNDTDRETIEMASSVLDEIIKDNMADIEKERAIYDWMYKNIKLDDGTLTLVNENDYLVDNPHGVLKTRKAVCVGYATTFRMFMEMLDIPCRIIHDDSKSHSWDIVQIDDSWYHVDLYSAVSGSGDFYFNAPDDIIRGGETDWDTSYFPTADSIEHYAPFENNRAKVQNVLAIPNEVRKFIDDESSSMCIEFESTPDDESMLIADSMIDAINSYIIHGDSTYLEYYWYYYDDKDYFIISYYSEDAESTEDSEEFSDDLEDAASKALREAFGDMDEDIQLY